MNGNILKSILRMKLQAGFDDKGNEILKTKSFSNISILATDEQLRKTAEALTTLQVHTLEVITRTNDYFVG